MAAALWSAVAVVSVLLLGAGGCGEARRTGGGGSAVIHLLDRLDRVQVEGRAAGLVGGGGGAPPGRVLLAIDFEQGELEPLRRAIPDPGGRLRAGRAPRVVGGEEACSGGRCAELSSGDGGLVGLVTDPLPVSALDTYRLRFRSAARTTSEGRGGVFVQPWVTLYRFTPEQAERAAELLADPERKEAAWLPGPDDFYAPGDPGTHPWSERRATFHVHPDATHMVLRFDLGRVAKDGPVDEVRGTAWLDDVEVTATWEPLHRRYRPSAPEHALEVAARLPHPSDPSATEIRRALYAPAPSTLAVPVRLPDGEAALSVGYGLLPEARAAAPHRTRFTVSVRARGGSERVLHRAAVDSKADETWKDATVDLRGLAGREVVLVLRTEVEESPPVTAERGGAAGPEGVSGGRDGKSADAGPPPAADRRPAAASESSPQASAVRWREDGARGAGAVWSGPVLHDAGRRGKLVLLVGIDTLPAARSSTYGYERETTPRLTAIAEQGVRFEEARTPAPWTLPSFASIFTGLDVAAHRAGEPWDGSARPQRPLAARFDTLAERLRRAGFETTAFINNAFLRPAFGLHQGFDRHVDYATRGQEKAAGPAVDALAQLLALPSGADRFVFLHLMDPHGPYLPTPEYRRRFAAPGEAGRLDGALEDPLFGELLDGSVSATPEERERIRSLYDALVAYTDAQLGRVFEAARAAVARPEDLVFAVVADHGEEHWEHGLFEHGHSVYQELLRVPLVIVAPGRARAGRVVRTPASAADLAPTLLELAGLPVPPDLDAQSLAPFLRGAEPPDGRAFVAGSTLIGVDRLAVERSGLKYIYNQRHDGAPRRRAPLPPSRRELYRLEDDPGETRNLAAQEPAAVAELHDALAAALAPSLRGRCLVFLHGPRDGSAPAVTLAGSLRLPPGGQWSDRADDLIWPRGDGAEAPLEIHWPDRRTVRFQVSASRALLAFPLAARSSPGPLEISVDVDGRPAPPDRLRIGASRRRSTHVPATLQPDTLAMRPDDLPVSSPAPSPPVVHVGCVPTEDEPSSAPAIGRDLRDQLEGLGYLER